MRKGNQELVKTLNKSILVQLLQTHGRLSRVDITERTQLSPSTVTVLADELLESGLIQECGTAESSGGRKPRLLELNPQGGYIIGIDLGGNAPRGGLVNLRGQVEQQLEQEASAEERPITVDGLFGMIENLMARVPANRLMGIGVSVPGLLNTDTVVLSSLLQWEGVELGAALKQRFNTRVGLLNDGNAAAIAEFRHGLGRGVDYLLYVGAGRGIGSGLILGGAVYTGPRGMAGELGHITVDLTGPPCRCGNRGCLGAVASGRYLADRAREAIKAGTPSAMLELAGGDFDRITTREMVTAAAHGDALARQFLIRSGQYIGAGVASMINTLTPQMVIIGGSMIHEGSVLLQTIQQEVPTRVLPVHRDIPVVQTSLGEDGKLIGAATVVLEQILKPVQLLP